MCLDESRIELIKETCEAAAEENKQTHQTVKFFQQFGVKARKRKHGVEFDLSELTDDQRKALDKALN
jgi:Spy/CpxP family protein refolding chaperone